MSFDAELKVAFDGDGFALLRGFLSREEAADFDDYAQWDKEGRL
mgnify:FL=1